MSIAPDLSCWSTSRTVFATPETPSASKPQPPAATTCSPRWRYWLCWEFKTLQGYTGLGVPEPSDVERSDDLEHATAAIERLAAMKDLRSMVALVSCEYLQILATNFAAANKAQHPKSRADLAARPFGARALPDARKSPC